jgi:hypothetical protein
MASVFVVMIPGTSLFSVKTLENLETSAANTFGFAPSSARGGGETCEGSHGCAERKPGI